MRRLERYRNFRPDVNTLYDCFKFSSRLKVIANSFIFIICQYLPWFSVKNLLYRMTGMHVGRKVAIGFMAMFGIFYPSKIFIGDNSIIGYNTVILEHEFLVNEYRFGEVHIGRGVLIGANCTVLCGVTIGDGAVVGAGSVVTKDIPANTFVAGNPARVLRKV